MRALLVCKTTLHRLSFAVPKRVNEGVMLVLCVCKSGPGTCMVTYVAKEIGVGQTGPTCCTILSIRVCATFNDIWSAIRLQKITFQDFS